MFEHPTNARLYKSDNKSLENYLKLCYNNQKKGKSKVTV